jgi:hypothetical protein
MTLLFRFTSLKTPAWHHAWRSCQLVTAVIWVSSAELRSIATVVGWTGVWLNSHAVHERGYAPVKHGRDEDGILGMRAQTERRALGQKGAA